jgi:hypothetical protein
MSITRNPVPPAAEYPYIESPQGQTLRYVLSSSYCVRSTQFSFAFASANHSPPQSMSVFDGIVDLFEEAGEGAGEDAVDDAVAEGVDGQMAEFTDAGVEPELDAEGNPVDGEDPAQGMKEGADEVGADVKAGKPIGERLKAAMKTMWNSKWKFAKFVGMEAAKGALFYAGSKAVETIWDAATKKDPSPTNDARLQIIKACNGAGDIISPITTEWRAWLTAHFDKRDDYGTVTVEDIDISRFQILQAKFSDITSSQDAIHALAVAANTNKDVTSAKALLAKWKEYVGMAVDVGTDIKKNESLMVADGLKDHSVDLASATEKVNAV